MSDLVRVEFPPALLTRELAAYYISGTLRDIDDLRARGEITPVGKQKRVKFKRADLDSYIERLEEKQ